MNVNQQVFFREVTLRASGSLDAGEVLRDLMEYLQAFMPVDTMGLHKLDRDHRVLLAVREVSRNGTVKRIQEDNRRFPIDDEMMHVIADAEQRDATIHNDPHRLPRSVRRSFPHLENRSVLSLILRIKGEQIGGLVLSAVGHGRYTETHAALLEEVKDPIALAMSNAWRYHELERLKERLADENRALAVDLEHVSGAQVVGAEFGLAQVMEMVRRVAPMTSPVLLLGETGTGKEVIANAIHLSSPRSEGPMVRVQCGALPEALLDSELFGHEKGAFTGAFERKRGRFERADGGTIFLDEIGELTMEAQVKLLRVLQEKQFERIGGAETLTVNVRVIAATHRDLDRLVREGRFREDLWYRLNVFPIRIPPLRLRREDIPALAHYFIDRKVREMSLGRSPRVDDASMNRLQAYAWPGNVRELQNVIERALILCRGDMLHFPDMQDSPSASPAAPAPQSPTAPAITLDEAIAEHIRRALTASGGRVAGRGGAAERLDIHPSTLRFRMRKLGIRVTRAVD